jgi:hypothetical protein
MNAINRGSYSLSKGAFRNTEGRAALGLLGERSPHGWSEKWLYCLPLFEPEPLKLSGGVYRPASCLLSRFCDDGDRLAQYAIFPRAQTIALQ